MKISEHQKTRLNLVLDNYIKEIRRFTQANESYAIDMLLLAMEQKNVADTTTSVAINIFRNKQNFQT